MDQKEIEGSIIDTQIACISEKLSLKLVCGLGYGGCVCGWGRVGWGGVGWNGLDWKG